MRIRVVSALSAVALVAGGVGCIDVTLPESVTVFPSPVSFVVNGTAQAIEDNGSCYVWLADDGTLFVLFQDPSVKNSDFDKVVVPGARSRLYLTVRTDLGFLGQPCVEGATVVQVNKVLSIGGAATP